MSHESLPVKNHLFANHGRRAAPLEDKQELSTSVLLIIIGVQR